MEEIVVISSTNRPNSNTLKVSKVYEDILKSKNVDVKILDLAILPENVAFGEVFGKRSEGYTQLLDKYVVNAKKFIFVVPEYNGSFPGILKIFIDSMHPKFWENKDVCLGGIRKGRSWYNKSLNQFNGICK